MAMDPDKLRQDQRILALIDSGKLPLPQSEALAHIHRRRGDLVAAKAEYDRLHGIGNPAPGVAHFHAVFGEQAVPPRQPTTDFVPAPFVQFNDFLGPQQNQALYEYALARQHLFHPTELQSADLYEKQRQNLVTYEVGPAGALMRERIAEELPGICQRLNMAAIAIRFVQLKLGAYLGGDFFKAHQDNGENHPDRLISFVYYFNREPKPYRGGDLLLYDSRFSPRAYVRTVFTRIIPRNNSIVFFPSEYFHEVTPIETDTQDFASSRFTLAGHVT